MSRVLITGCSSGLGRATARELAGRGHDVIATARRAEALQDLDVAQRLSLDVCDHESVRAAVQRAGHVDVVINNAGVLMWGPVEHASLDEARRTFDTNFLGVVDVIQQVLPQMRERRRGRIVNISSLAASVVPPFVGLYAASKVALEAMSEALRLEVGHLGIDVVVVEPPHVDTHLRSNALRGPLAARDYQALAERQEAMAAQVQEASPDATPEQAAAEIADIVEMDDPRLRYVLTDHAQARVARRKALTDREYERELREKLGLSSSTVLSQHGEETP